MKILVSKNEEFITISFNGSKLIINKDNILFEELNKKTKLEIKNWYISKGEGGE